MYAGMVILALAAATAATVPFDGSRLRAGDTCYDITVRGKTVGSTRQSIKATETKGRPTWDITVHQLQPSSGFDMTDHFIVDRTTMRPLSLESDRGKERSEKGWHRIRLAYTDQGVTGTRETSTGTTPINVAFDHPVWDGNLWGLTFAALPLKEGATFTVPVWQYDKGAGQFTIKVEGKETVHTPQGDVSAWKILAGDSPDQPVHYKIAVSPPAELGYEAGPFAQVMGACGKGAG
ncbi:DUF3108 domain-containing protein [Bacillus sp. NP157]|nr:DUF3108 domain-containing protein [Bacillus sp. NP157]